MSIGRMVDINQDCFNCDHPRVNSTCVTLIKWAGHPAHVRWPEQRGRPAHVLWSEQRGQPACTWWSEQRGQPTHVRRPLSAPDGAPGPAGGVARAANSKGAFHPC